MKNLLFIIFFFQFGCYFYSLIDVKSTKSNIGYNIENTKIGNFTSPLNCDSLVVYSEFNDINSYLWIEGDRMPDGNGISVKNNCTDRPHNGSTCIKIGYQTDLNGFVGINWLPRQLKENGQGINLDSIMAAKNLTLIFWARGELGDEKIKCQVGGNTNFDDSMEFPKGTNPQLIKLTQNWQIYKIDLSRANLSNVVTIFSVWLSADKNWGEREVHVYIDDIVINGE